MKKLLSILLVLVLCTSLMALTASAEGGYAVKVSSHELNEGTKELTVTVTITENAGIGGLIVTPVYDSSVLELVTPVNSCGIEGGMWMNGTTATWVSTDGSNTTYTGAVATMKFNVLKEEDTTVSVTIDAGVFDDSGKEKSVTFTVADGAVDFICEHKSGTNANTTDATCDTEGKIEYVCKKCGEITKTETIKAKGHTKGAAVTENEVAATCDKDGSKDSVVYCTVCQKEVSRETLTIKALGHTEGAAVTENEVAPTCEKTGSKDTVVYCTVCQKEVSRKTETIKALGHNYELTGTTASECGKPGVNTYTCKNDASHVKTENVAALEHQWDEGAVTTAPTCTEKGVKTYNCKRGCGETKTEEVAALGHTKAEAVKENEVAPTCTKTGSYDEVVYCSVCNEKLSTKTVEVKALGHDWDEGTVTTAATCYADGVMTHACKNGCDETKTSAITERPAHTVTNWAHDDAVYCIGTCDVAECGAAVKEKHVVNEWTQNEDGEYVGTCATCKQADINKGDLIPAGDITPILVMGGVAVFSMLAAAAYVTCRKFAK